MAFVHISAYIGIYQQHRITYLLCQTTRIRRMKVQIARDILFPIRTINSIQPILHRMTSNQKYQPKTPVIQKATYSDDACSDDVNAERIGHTSWCTCTRCRAMNTIQESLCCKEDVPGNILGDNKCITEHEEFAIVCLNAAVLRTTLSMLNNLRGENIEIESISYRYAAYRQFT